MTSKESTQLAVATNDIKTIKGDLKDIKALLLTYDERFITRREAKVANWLFGFMVSALVLWQSMQEFMGKK
jgi:hypothetical protein